MAPDTPIPYDLVVYVYPQPIADLLGRTWESRVTVQWYAGEGDHFSAVLQAVFLGQAEYEDPTMLRRLLAEGLGMNGARNDLRPYIDGRCLDPGNPACGPELPEP